VYTGCTLATHAFSIGIDTGGTYTDAVVLDHATRKIVAAGKAITTKGDLAVGIGEALTSVLTAIAPGDVGMVSVSTTLATNAVVEGHGDHVGMVLIGFDDAMSARTGITRSYPGCPLIRVAGGHDHHGAEAQPLDANELRRLAAEHDVSAFAVASTFAVRNPTHEIAARTILSEATGKPVTLSRDLSTSLDAPKRALTALLNARLIARISALVAAVARAMQELGLDCPLMVVKGDGSLARAEEVALRPLETVLSGPAASLIGARWLSGLDDFLMSDIGGTTTDVGIMADGRPRILEEGALVGPFRTMVQAVDIRTTGLGGDSEIKLAMDGSLELGPERAVPVSLLASRYPEALAILEAELGQTDGGSFHGRFALLPFGGERRETGSGLNTRERDLLAQIGPKPAPLRQIAVNSGAQRALASLRTKGLVQLSCFTPSDAAHVLGLQKNWNGAAARLAAQLVVRHRSMKVPTDEVVVDFCREVRQRVIAKSATAVLAAAFDGDRAAHGPLVDAVSEGRPRLGLVDVSLSPSVPIVAVGGPARVYYEDVGQRLGCPVVFTDHHQVANAVGAAAGLAGLRVSIAVEGDGGGAFRVFSPDGVEHFSSGPDALAFARTLGRDIASRDARQRGMKAPDLTLSEAKSLLPDAVDDNGLLSARIVVEAVSKSMFR
jgi:N-methylhydantoinase A/oxoprolinase/acetone carboxylase beta subunit